MKKSLVFLLVLCLILTVSSAALAGGAPKITKQPVSQTTDKKGSVTFTFKGSNYSVEESGWRFINPATGEEWSAVQLRDEVMAGEKGFKLKAADKKRTLTLSGVPESMHGWEVYVRLVNNGYEINSDHVHLWCYGLEAPAEDSAPSAQAAASPSGTESSDPAPSGESTSPSGTVGEIPADGTPAGPKMITVTATKADLFPVDSKGTILEDQKASTLSFEGSANVAVRSEEPVKYWTINGIRVEPIGETTGFVFRNVTSDMKISAKLDNGTAAADEVDFDSPCQVVCEGCVFTSHDAGLFSVSSGSVPSGATIFILSNGGEGAAKGYRINGGDIEHKGDTSFRLKITEDVTISVP